MLRDATEPGSQGGRTWHGGGAVKDNDATSKVTETSVLPFRQVAKLQSWRSVRSMELGEQLLLHVTTDTGILGWSEWNSGELPSLPGQAQVCFRGWSPAEVATDGSFPCAPRVPRTSFPLGDG